MTNMPHHLGGLEKSYYEMDDEDFYDLAVQAVEDPESVTPAEISILAQFIIDKVA